MNPRDTLNITELLNNSTEAGSIAVLAQAATQATLETIGGVTFLSRAQNIAVEIQEHLGPHPLRNRGTVQLLTLNDLVGYLKKQTIAGTALSGDTEWNPVIFADRANLRFTSILNYPTAFQTAWADNRAIVGLRKSRQLQTWQGKNATKMSQEQFALFLEENIEDIHVPTGAEVLTFAETLEATRTETFKSSIITSTGEQKLSYCSERDGERCSTLITKITLGIPLFEGGPGYSVEAKISHRVTEGKLTFWYDLRHIEHIIDRAWLEECTYLAEHAADLAVIYNGTAPEVQAPLKVA
jgi:uncharacterized protein YfdQ (DUF2303 family)